MTFPSKLEVWIADLSGGKGHEQEKERPALIWKDLDHVKMAIIIPFTTNQTLEDLPYTYLVTPSSKNRLTEESIALIFQIRAISKERLIVECTHICPKIVHELMSAFTHPFGWENGESGYGNQAQVGCSLF